jgi:hypothetical protein
MTQATDATGIREKTQERYWEPPQLIDKIVSIPPKLVCPACQTESLPQAFFCYYCGRPLQAEKAHFFEAHTRLVLGRRVMAFLIGALAFVLIAWMLPTLASDWFMDWQRAHFWKTEWLLASVLTLLVAILIELLELRRR